MAAKKKPLIMTDEKQPIGKTRTVITTDEMDKIATRAAKKVLGVKTPGLSTSLEEQDIKREEMRQLMKEVLYWYGAEKVKTVDELAERTASFFEHVSETGEIATWEKYCLALGTVRETVNEWERGDSGPEFSDVVKKAKAIISGVDASLVSAGKLNTVAYIFRSKNFYGMKDQQDVVVQAGGQVDYQSAEALEAKYADTMPAEVHTEGEVQ